MAQVVALFINTYDEKEMESQIYEILKAFLRFNMLNINVLSYRKDSNIVQASTYYPYADTNCANDVINLQTVEECEYSDDDPDLMPLQKLERKVPLNLHLCPLKISGSVSEPYVFYDEQDGFVEGTEVLMIRTIAEALEMTPLFSYINETRENREINAQKGIYSTLFQRYDAFSYQIRFFLNEFNQ